MAIKHNLHSIDITLRAFAGVSLIYVGFVNVSYVDNGFLRWALMIFGIANLLAATFRFCPIYALAGISTRRQ